MGLKKLATTSILFFLLFAPAKALGRNTKYVGLEFSLFESVFIDNFTRHVDGVLDEKNTFVDDYSGQSFGFYLGYSMIDKEKVFINLQAHYRLYAGEYSLETSSSTLTRRQCCSFGIDLQPGFFVKSRFLCFFNFSVERGRFHYSKHGTSTTYDIMPTVFGYGIGVGIGYKIIPSVCVKLRYQYVQYGKSEILTTLFDSSGKIDSVELFPRSEMFVLSLQYDFGSK